MDDNPPDVSADAATTSTLGETELDGLIARWSTVDVVTWVADAPPAQAERIETAARARIRAMPTPIHARTQDPLASERRLLRRIVAAAAAALGRPAELFDVLRVAWLHEGASVMPLLLTLRQHGYEQDAAAAARLALFSAEGAEEVAIEDFLTQGASVPPGWDTAVRELASAPSVAAWRALLQFTPPEQRRQRTRSTARMLRRLGVPSDTVFRLVAVEGITRAGIDLAELGLVSVSVVLECAAAAPAHMRGLWWGLAARSAFAQGDRFGTVRLLSEALRIAEEPFVPIIQVMDIRDAADEELHQMLDRAGVPRLDS